MDSIRIVINGQDLDLPSGFSVDREEESSIFNRELDRKDFTYPANIPLTENNDVILGHISNLAIGEKKREFQADLYFNDTYDNLVTVRVLNVSTLNKTIEISIIGTYGTFARLVGDKKLATLALGGDRIVGTTSGSPTILGILLYEFEQPFPGQEIDVNTMSMTTVYYGCSTANHMKSVMMGTTIADYCFYPAFDNKANIEGLNDSGSNVINFYDWDAGIFVDPAVEYYRSEMMQKHYDQRSFWVPFFKTLFVLRKCFEESGFIVSGNIFSDPNFQKSTLYNTTTFCKYDLQETNWDSELVDGHFLFSKTITITNRSNVIHPQDHMPDMSVLEFINEVAKAWNLQYRINLKLRTVDIVQLKFFKSTAPVIDFSGIAFPEHEINFDENDLVDGYKFEFTQDPAETYLSSKQNDELGDYPVVASANILSGLSGSFTLNDLAYIRRENAYYQYGGAGWFFYSYNGYAFQTKEKAANPLTISTKAVPLVNADVRLYRTGLDGDGNVAIVEKTLFMPHSTIGIKGSKLLTMKYPKGTQNKVLFDTLIGLKNSDPINIRPILVNNHGLQPNADMMAYPFGSSFCRTTAGNAITGVNLYWDCPDHNGLYYNQWKAWTDSLINSIPVKFNVVFSGVTEDMIDYESNILFIKDQQYVLRKSTKPLPFPCVATFELIRI